MQDHLPVIYTVVQSRGVAMQFSGGKSHAESSAILQGEGFLLYLYGPLTVTLMRMWLRYTVHGSWGLYKKLRFIMGSICISHAVGLYHRSQITQKDGETWVANIIIMLQNNHFDQMAFVTHWK